MRRGRRGRSGYRRGIAKNGEGLTTPLRLRGSGYGPQIPIERNGLASPFRPRWSGCRGSHRGGEGSEILGVGRENRRLRDDHRRRRRGCPGRGDGSRRRTGAEGALRHRRFLNQEGARGHDGQCAQAWHLGGSAAIQTTRITTGRIISGQRFPPSGIENPTTPSCPAARLQNVSRVNDPRSKGLTS